MNFQTSSSPNLQPTLLCATPQQTPGCTLQLRPELCEVSRTLPSCSLPNPSPSPDHSTSRIALESSHFQPYCPIASLHSHLGHHTPDSSLAPLLPVLQVTVPRSLAPQSTPVLRRKLSHNYTRGQGRVGPECCEFPWGTLWGFRVKE